MTAEKLFKGLIKGLIVLVWIPVLWFLLVLCGGFLIGLRAYFYAFDDEEAVPALLTGLAFEVVYLFLVFRIYEVLTT